MHKILSDKEILEMKEALKRNYIEDDCILMDPKTTRFVGSKTELDDDEFERVTINSIKNIPVHF